MKLSLARVLGPTEAVKPGHAICLFVLLQIYFSSNMLSFGFWKSGNAVFGYMLVYYGAWIAGLVVALSLFLAAARRFEFPWLALTALFVLSVPFAWDLWVPSIEIDRDAIRRTVHILLLPATFLYFRIGLESVRWTACAVLLLCVIAFTGHSGVSVSTGKSHDFDRLEMDRKPNVHVIMLDSFTHSPFTKEFMGIENPAADFLESLDDAVHAGSMGFSEHVPTKYAWASLFSLGRRSTDFGAFSGSTPSRLTVLLRENGYGISTGFSGNYFGWNKGEHVDHYYRGVAPSLDRVLACTTGKGKLGFCSRFSRSFFSRLVATETEDAKGRSKRAKAWPDKVVDLIDHAERNATTPLFSAFHIYWPFGHTRTDYRTGDAEMFAEYKRDVVKKAPHARKVIEDIDRLRKRHPESIFIVSGDHGPYLSRTASEEDRRFIVLDRHGVGLALLNASNLCAWSRDWLDRQRFLTASRMLAASLACDGESRRLTEKFTDNDEFIRFGASFATGKAENPEHAAIAEVHDLDPTARSIF